MSHRVVNLGDVRNLMASWDEVGRRIKAGRIGAYAITIQDDEGRETVYMAGKFKSEPAQGLRASLRMSMEINRQVDAGTS